MKNDNLEFTAAIVDVGLKILSDRFLTVLALLLDCVVFVWAMYADSWIRLTGATIFAIANWCIIHLKPPKGGES